MQVQVNQPHRFAESSETEDVSLEKKWAIVAATNLRRSTVNERVEHDHLEQVAANFKVSASLVSKIVKDYDDQILAGVEVPSLRSKHVLPEVDSSMCLFLTLPAEIVCDIVGKWLQLPDITRLDSAICNAEQRGLFLSLVQSPLCLLAKVPANRRHYVPDTGLQWFAVRRIRMDFIHLSGRNSDFGLWAEYLKVFGSHVKSAEVSSDDPCAAPALLVQYCPNLSSLVWLSGVEHGFANVLTNCHRLTSVTVFTSARDYARLHDVPATHHLLLENIDVNVIHGAFEEFILKFCAPSHVRKLRLNSILPVRDWSQFVNLRSLGVTSSLSHEHKELFVQLLHCCPLIADLDLSYSGILRDQLVYNICCALSHLRTLNIQYAEYVTDASLRSIARYQKRTLEALFVLGCNDFTVTGMNHILSECLQLRTLSCSSLSRVDISLMGSITTLITNQPYDVSPCYTYEGDYIGVWQDIRVHCHNLMNLHISIVHSECKFAVSEAITTACMLPKFRALYMSDLDIKRAEAAEKELAIRRPTVRFLREYVNRWYDLFDMPV